AGLSVRPDPGPEEAKWVDPPALEVADPGREWASADWHVPPRRPTGARRERPPRPVAAVPEPPRAAASDGRRTVTITGRGSERYMPPPRARRRPPQRAHERPGFRPDRAGLWAVLRGLLLVLVAASSAHAA